MSIDEELKQAIQKFNTNADIALESTKIEHRTQVAEITLDFEKKMDKLVDRIKTQATAVTIAVAAGVALAFIMFLFSAVKDVNQSVISLQKDVLSAQTVVQKAREDLEKAKAEGEQTIRASTKELDAASTQVTKARADLEVAQKHLMDTEKEYSARLAELQIQKSKKAP